MTLPIIVKCIILHGVPSHIQVKGYDLENMPMWSQYMVYPAIPSNVFKITSPWYSTDSNNTKSNHGGVYYARGKCQFNLYHPKIFTMQIVPSPSPLKPLHEQGVYFSCEDEQLYMYKLINNQYHVFTYDDLGDIDYAGINFKFDTTYDKDEFLGPDVVLIRNIKNP